MPQGNGILPQLFLVQAARRYVAVSLTTRHQTKLARVQKLGVGERAIFVGVGLLEVRDDPAGICWREDGVAPVKPCQFVTGNFVPGCHAISFTQYAARAASGAGIGVRGECGASAE
jgi:hypothetical protein